MNNPVYVCIYIYIYIYIIDTHITPIMIINRIYEHQNLLSLWLISVLVGLRTYQHPCIFYLRRLMPHIFYLSLKRMYLSVTEVRNPYVMNDSKANVY
jgi:hypothetical protein